VGKFSHNENIGQSEFGGRKSEKKRQTADYADYADDQRELVMR
jgi:hypothetical protein